MRHHAFKAQGGIAIEACEERSERFVIDTLATHAGVDLEVNREGADARRMCRRFKLVEMKRIPYDGGELVMDDVLPLAGEDAADDEDARVRTKTARLNTLFNTGDSEPTGSGANHSR